MEILIAAVGKPRSPGLADAIRHYELRASHYFRLRSVEVSAASLPDAREAEARAREAEALLRIIPSALELVALTRAGKALDTRALAAYLEDMATYGRAGAAFAVGGAHGLGDEVLGRAHMRLSLSEMTLPHELARLFLTEQLYRAGTLIRGEAYHKGP
jgi:23S rRNA (pseudouridine1915-N3)-methyltransferase